MLITTELLEDFPDYHDFFGYEPEHCLFFDIETTGLSASSSAVFLIGTIHRVSDGWQLTQYFAMPQEEKALLRQFLNDTAPFSALIHFNGASFDLPYLEAKCRACHLPGLTGSEPGGKVSIDLYQSFRPLKKLLAMERMNQASLEQAVGWHRKDVLTGKQMTAFYRNYGKTEDPEVLRLMLLHNHDDLVGMTQVLRLAPCLMLFQGVFGRVTDCALTEDRILRITFSLHDPVPIPFQKSILLFRKASCCLTAENDTAVLELPGLEGEFKYFFPDYKNYDYLPLEDEAIHKRVAAYIEKEYRVPAKASTCYTRKTGLFFPQPEAVLSPVFRTSYEDPGLYFEFGESVSADHAHLRELLCSVLPLFLKGAVQSCALPAHGCLRNFAQIS